MGCFSLSDTLSVLWEHSRTTLSPDELDYLSNCLEYVESEQVALTKLLSILGNVLCGDKDKGLKNEVYELV